MKRSGVGFAVLAMMLLTFSACGGDPPQQEMEAARAAVAQAKEGGADKWAPNEFQASEASLSAAEAEMDAQGQKWFKNFDKTKELLAQVITDAERAQSAAVTNKENSRQEATTAIEEARTALEGAQTALKGARVGKDTKADLALFKQDLEGLAASLSEAEAAMEQEEYNDARDTAVTVKEKATSIREQIAGAGAKK